MEALLRPALEKPPCMVAFSGGLDSSTILAVATDVARRFRLEDPVPLTFRYQSHPRTWEAEWQELMVRHLGLKDWKIVDFQAEFDVLGPMAREALRRHGLYWPPNSHTTIPMLEAARGGSLLTGNGGDEVFRSVTKMKTMTPMQILRSMPPHRALAVGLVNSLPLRWKIFAQYRHGLAFPWLRRSARREVRRRFVDNAVQRRRGERHYLEQLGESRYLELELAIASALARDANVDLVDPFFEPPFLRALLAGTPEAGFPSRNAALEHFFGDLLPPELTRRTSKAVFTESFWGPDSREFARRWDGRGLDPSLMRVDALRSQWLRPRPDMRSATAIQAAWLASEGAV
jgi:asparagine synthase (glutamine-hydrolysing)